MFLTCAVAMVSVHVGWGGVWVWPCVRRLLSDGRNIAHINHTASACCWIQRETPESWWEIDFYDTPCFFVDFSGIMFLSSLSLLCVLLLKIISLPFHISEITHWDMTCFQKKKKNCDISCSCYSLFYLMSSDLWITQWWCEAELLLSS